MLSYHFQAISFMPETWTLACLWGKLSFNAMLLNFLHCLSTFAAKLGTAYLVCLSCSCDYICLDFAF